MSRKLIALVVVVGLTAIAAIAFRSMNRADAAAGSCYSATQGPNTPTICG